MHVGKDRPRDDVVVVVISVMSTNTAGAVKGFSFQAAVPKVSTCDTFSNYASRPYNSHMVHSKEKIGCQKM